MGGPLGASHTAFERRAGDGSVVEVWHRQSSFIMDVRLQADLGLVGGEAAGLAAVVELPLRLFDTSIRYEDEAGQEVAIQNAGVHHRNETLFGVSDPLLGVRGVVRAGDLLLEGRAGVRLPFGATQPDPFVLGDAGLEHQHVLMGTGTVDPELGLGAFLPLDDVTLGLWGSARLALYENEHGYEAGDRWSGGLFAASGLGLEDWGFVLGADLAYESAERWSGVVPTDDGNRGRTDVFVLAAVDWRPSADTSVGLAVRVPVYTHVVGGQLDFPILVELTVGGRVALWEPPHVDDPHHAPAPAPLDPHAPTGDEADVTEVAPVPGKVTVVDVWAAWCGPCLELGPMLSRLAAAHPSVALRRLEVRHPEDVPGVAALPWVRVFDPSGALVYEGTGDPAALAAEVERRARALAPRAP